MLIKNKDGNMNNNEKEPFIIPSYFKMKKGKCGVHNKQVDYAYIPRLKNWVKCCEECLFISKNNEKQEEYNELLNHNKNRFPFDWKDINFDFDRINFPESIKKQANFIKNYINEYIHKKEQKDLLIIEKGYDNCKNFASSILNKWLEKSL